MKFILPILLLLLIGCPNPSDDEIIEYPQNVTKLKALHAGSPDIVFDESGNIHLVYVSYENVYSFDVNYSTQLGDTLWSDPIALSESEISDGNPRIEIDVDGMLHSIWAGGGRTFYSKTNSLGDWLEKEIIFDDYSSVPQIQIDEFNNLHVISSGNIYGLYRKSDNGVWSDVEILPFSLTNPDIDMNNNIVHLTFENRDMITYSQRSADPTWTEIEIVYDGEGYPISPEIAVDDSGYVYVAWWMFYENKILLKKRNLTGEWVWINPLPDPSDYIKDLKILELDSDIHVFWSGSTSGSAYEIFYQTLFSDGTWSSRENISNSSVNSRTPTIETLNGDLYIAWREEVDEHTYYFDIYLNIVEVKKN